MIPLVPTSEYAASPLAGDRTIAAFLRAMVKAWIAHHQRLADIGLSGSGL